MKDYITFSCGHKGEVELFGKNEERQKKVEYLEKYGVCPHCKEEQEKEKAKKEGLAPKRINYWEYKSKYSKCKSQSGSYDGKTKTIVVYIPEREI